MKYLLSAPLYGLKVLYWGFCAVTLVGALAYTMAEYVAELEVKSKYAKWLNKKFK